MNNIRFKVCTAAELVKFQSELLAFEKEFVYPLSEHDNFYISHGARYADFFERMGDSRYLLALDGERIIGMISAVKKQLNYNGKAYTAFYLADLKIKQAYRGQGLSQQFYWKILKLMPRLPYAWKWSTCYFVGMVGDKGDVSQSFNGSLPTRLIRSLGYLHIYFATHEQLTGLSENYHEASANLLSKTQAQRLPVLALSSSKTKATAEYTSLLGVKDIILQRTNKALQLCHVNLHQKTDAEVMQALARIVSQQNTQHYEQYCFAIDERRTQLIEQLAHHGMVSDSRAHVQGFSLSPIRNKYAYISLNTDEI